MADLNVELKRALDGPAPQHKVAGQEELEVTEGSDGHLHVKDSELLNKLNELDNIKETQGQIIDVLRSTNESLLETNEKLSSVIEDGRLQSDTQLTGSNVEDGIPVQVEKDFIEITVSAQDIPAESDKVFDVYSNPGEIWTLQRFGYDCGRDTDATGGHAVWVYHGEGSSTERFILSIGRDNNNFLRGAIPGRREGSYAGETNPDSNYELVETLRGTTVLSDKLPIRIRYRNYGDKPMPNALFKLFFLVEKVGE
ncbi:hypothetical protein J2Z83_003721 [Virgibacillus natechei]|uniref:Uncharacterized protein n=1 Tax=Virgibacillus natechei TaxID=1216297 RepID=A0ABS4ILX6_9BACI|nr:hypothetical protein [Virgibacillus natechei]MBP1971570.1 hypothetical protein [Virgibacillus natechei]UZD13096.1 hypothetical protein OLD84_00515 [Virgibacillus natechei]